MTEPIRLAPPLSADRARTLHAGDAILLDGVIYAARDAAHRRLIESLKRGETLPFPLEGAIIYYVGPTPPRPGQALGAAGPTTSYRMDAYAPTLLAAGARGMIGKGERGPAVVEAMQRHAGVYFAATGGAGALLGRCIVAADIIAYPELGPEAVRRLEVRDFPLIVATDAFGQSLYHPAAAHPPEAR